MAQVLTNGIIGNTSSGKGDHFWDNGEGNHASASLSGLCKIKLRGLGYRVVYQLIREGEVMRIIVVSIRDDEAAYREAERRIRTMEL